MKVKSSLYSEILSLLFLYLATILVVIFVCFNFQFGIGWHALLRSPAGDRVDAAADAISSRLGNVPMSGWNEVLNDFAKIYRVRFYVFDMFGQQLAGQRLILPEPLYDRIREELPPPPDAFTQHFPGKDAWMLRTVRPNMFPAGPFPGMPMPPDVVPPGPGVFFTRNMPGQPLIPPQLMHAHGRFLVDTKKPDCFWIGTRVLLIGPQMEHPLPGVILAQTDNLWQTNLLLDFNFLAYAAAIIFILSIIFWCPYIYRITRALTQLSAATEQIAEGRFDTRLKSQGKNEIGRLADAINTMAAKLEELVTSQKRFLGDISHELISPLARMQVALTLLDESQPGERRELMNDIWEEADEMNNLVHELLAFAKAGVKGRTLELTEVNVKATVEEVVNRLHTDDVISIDVPSSLSVIGDPLLLNRAFSNVIRNSLRYAKNSGPITVKAVTEGSQVSITIADHGPGVPEEALSHLAEPFFRPEPSRDRSSGGVGLGLAIVKSCIKSCNGSVCFRNLDNRGFEVEMKMTKGQSILSQAN